ncbi:MAG: ABC transporter substrate-binding protein [Pseudomonadota bacterium]
MFATIGLMTAGGGAVRALESDAAKAHVQASVDDVMAIVRSSEDTDAKAKALEAVMENRAAMPQIARFSAGLAWRDMTDDQKERFTKAFSHMISVVYARRFQTYSGETVTLGDVDDGGRRGLIVSSLVSQTSGAPIAVDWLVSDRPGRTVIADIIIENVSMLLTQRDEIAGMLKNNNGDIDALIDQLEAI